MAVFLSRVAMMTRHVALQPASLSAKLLPSRIRYAWMTPSLAPGFLPNGSWQVLMLPGSGNQPSIPGRPATRGPATLSKRAHQSTPILVVHRVRKNSVPLQVRPMRTGRIISHARRARLRRPRAPNLAPHFPRLCRPCPVATAPDDNCAGIPPPEIIMMSRATMVAAFVSPSRPPAFTLLVT